MNKMDMTSTVESFKCNWCGKLYKSETDADECAFKHAQENYANSLLNSGRSLNTINYLCGFNWKLNEEQKDITIHNCFVVSHWQCCDKPAYTITRIEKGRVYLSGKGSWSGYYGDLVRVEDLKNPRPESELFVDKR